MAGRELNRLASVAVLGAVLLALDAAEIHGQLAGRCFDGSFGPWEAIPGTHIVSHDPPPPPGPEHETRLFPPRLLLDDRPFDRDRRWNRVEVPSGALPVPRRYRVWRVEGDTLEISLSNGFTGVRGRFVQADDRWTGTVEYVTDNGGTQRYDRDAVLVEADCASEPPVPASVDPPAPRTVPSQDGPPLALGQPLPAQYDLEPDERVGPGGWVSGFSPEGPWAGAERILIRLVPDGRIFEIRVGYPEGTETESLAAVLVDEFGPGDPDAPWLTWWNHSTRSIFQRSGRPEVRLVDITLGRE